MDKEYKIVITTVVDSAGNILMIRRVNDPDDDNAGKWEFPAGHVDPGENPHVAAPRETFEETGLKVHLFPWRIDVPTKAGKAAQYLGFVADGSVKPEPILSDHEHDDFKWINARDVGEIKPTHKKMKEHLLKLLTHVNYKLNRNKMIQSDYRKGSVQTGHPFRSSLYRGIEKDPSRARKERIPRQFAVGEYWSTSPEVAETYGDVVVHKDVSVRNPYVLDLGEKPFYAYLQKNFGTSDPQKITDFLRDQGYDALVVRNVPVHRRNYKTREYTTMRNSTEVILLNRRNASRRKAQEMIPNRLVRQIPGPGEDLREAILVGDEVEIFLKDQSLRRDNPEPDLSGIVDKRNRNTVWIRPLDERDAKERMGKSIIWRNDGNWAFIRVYRDPDSVIHYIKGNPYGGDDKDIERSKGLGLIIESDPPVDYEAVWSLMRNETPDLDKSMGQAPESLDRVAPFSKPRPGIPPILHQVREVLRDSGLEPDLVDDLGNGRVLILTSDPDLKKDIVRVLKNSGNEIKATRMGGLLIKYTRKRVAQGTTTIPIATDDDLMRMTLLQKKRRLEREAANVPPIQTNPTTVNSPNKGLSPTLSLTLPSQKQQVDQLKGKYGDMKVQQLPNQSTQLTFSSPQQLQKFQQDMANYSVPGHPVSSRGGNWVRKVRSYCRGFRVAMRDSEYGEAGDFLSRLMGMGIRAEEIIRSRLASRNQWKDLYNYSNGVGEIEVSRLSRKAARYSPDR